MYKSIKAADSVQVLEDYWCYAALLLSKMESNNGLEVNTTVDKLEVSNSTFQRHGGSIYSNLVAYVNTYDNPIVWIDDSLYFIDERQRLTRVEDTDVIDTFRDEFGFGTNY